MVKPIHFILLGIAIAGGFMFIANAVGEINIAIGLIGVTVLPLSLGLIITGIALFIYNARNKK